MEAQRYPDDYDGIVGSAPANNRTGVHISILWNFDGVADGIINDPRKCSFNPASLECSGADNNNCLTASQVATARRLYTGPVDPRTGQQIYPGMPKGSELGWDHLGPGADGQPPYAPIFAWVFGRNWNWRSFDFDRSGTAVSSKLGGALNATSADLSTFRNHGHKLLIYHGWSDWLVVPGESIRYRNGVAARYPRENLDEFYRLFMVPGMTHCSGGVGPDHFDALSPMIDWVEKNHAPTKSSLLSSREAALPILRCGHGPFALIRRWLNIKEMGAAMTKQTFRV